MTQTFQYFSKNSDNIRLYFIHINCDCYTFTKAHTEKAAAQTLPCLQAPLMITSTKSSVVFKYRWSNKTGAKIKYLNKHFRLLS